jgi:hypothetical protein
MSQAEQVSLLVDRGLCRYLLCYSLNTVVTVVKDV